MQKLKDAFNWIVDSQQAMAAIFDIEYRHKNTDISTFPAFHIMMCGCLAMSVLVPEYAELTLMSMIAVGPIIKILDSDIRGINGIAEWREKTAAEIDALKANPS